MATAKYKRGKDGYFQARVWNGSYDDVGRKVYVSIRSKKSSRDLEEKVAEHKEKIKNRSLVKQSEITFGEYADRWLKIYKASRSGNTKAMYSNIINVHFAMIENVRLSEITRAHYQMVLNLAEGKPRTQQQIQCTFRQIIRSAVTDKYLPAGILEDIRVDPIRYRPAERRPLYDFEKVAVFQADLKPADKVFLYFLYGCGIRRGEALALTTQDIDLQQRRVAVERAVAFDGNNPYIKSTKSQNGRRSVPLPSSVYPFIAEYVNGLQEGAKLFPSRSGGWMTKSGYDRMWARIVKAMQNVSEQPITGLTAHVFRHNYCTNLCYQIPAISIKNIARLMGDTEKMVIEVYNHIVLEKESTEDAIENALNF